MSEKERDKLLEEEFLSLWLSAPDIVKELSAKILKGEYDKLTDEEKDYLLEATTRENPPDGFRESVLEIINKAQ